MGISVWALSANAQIYDTAQFRELRILGYVDAGWAWYSDEIPVGDFQKFTTVNARHNAVSLNAAQIGLNYAQTKLRAAITLHFGDIAQATWDSTFRPVQEANVGFEITKNWWLSAGFFTTHIGTESFLPKNNSLSSTTAATYNEPFYQAGARLSYEGREKLTAELWLLNGYNLFLDNNSAKTLGLLLGYDFSEMFALSYSNLLGYEQPSGAGFRAFRIYQNMYGDFDFGKFKLQIGGDLGIENYSEGRTRNAVMFNALVASRWQFARRFSLSGRVEHFNDKTGFISGTFENPMGNPQGLVWTAFTLGGEFRPVSGGYLRLEGRAGFTDNEIFITEGNPTDMRWEILTTMGFSFEELVKIR